MKITRLLRKAGRMLGLACAMAMWLVLGSMTLPVNPSTSSGTVGKDYFLYVNSGTVSVPVWTLIGGQRGSSLSRSGDSIDLSHKTSGGWGAKKQGLKNWSVDLDALAMLQDAGVAILDYAFMNSEEVHIKLEYPDGTYQTGWGSVNDWSLETPHDGEASISGTIEGNGALSDRTPSVWPLTASMSLAAAADVTFAITPTTTTVSSVTIDGTALTVTTHYSYSAGTLTIESTYLSTLPAGTYAMVVATGDGADLSVALTITA